MKYATLCAASLLAIASAAHAGSFFSEFSADELVELPGGDEFEARFKADRFNWDSRLEFDGQPNTGDNTANVTNNIGTLGSTTYSFELSNDAASNTVTWSLTDLTSSNTTLLSLTTADGDAANTLEIFTVGSRGEVTLTDLMFDGLGQSIVDADFPNLDTAPSGPTFLRTLLFLGNDANLYEEDWSLSGNIAFRNFTNNNPNEGAKITIKTRQSELVPAPGAAALMALSGFVGIRRKR